MFADDTLSNFARSAAACVPGVGCGVLGIVGCGVGAGAGRGVGAGAGRAQGSCVARARKVAQELLSSAPKAVASSSQHRVAHLLARGLGRIAAPPCGRGILLCYGQRSGQPHAAPGSRALAAPICEQFFSELASTLPLTDYVLLSLLSYGISGAADGPRGHWPRSDCEHTPEGPCVLLPEQEHRCLRRDGVGLSSIFASSTPGEP